MGSHGTEIKRLNDDSVRRIVAEQAITDLSSIVKELVDNALDAESATIKSKFQLFLSLSFKIYCFLKVVLIRTLPPPKSDCLSRDWILSKFPTMVLESHQNPDLT